eukprot:1785630-Rhodomonas_salina.1
MRALPARDDAALGALPDDFDVITTARHFLRIAQTGVTGVAQADELARREGQTRAQRVRWEKTANTRILECIMSASEMIPNITSMMH